MKDYNLRSRDIYGQPQQRGGRGWLKLVAGLLVAAAAAGGAYYYYMHRTPGPDPTPAAPSVAPKANPDIIPLTLPPRTPRPAAAQ
jgi:hypothetical protein